MYKPILQGGDCRSEVIDRFTVFAKLPQVHSRVSLADNPNSRVGNRNRLPAGHESLVRLAEEVMQGGHVIRYAPGTDGVLNRGRQMARLGRTCSALVRAPGGQEGRSGLGA